MKHVHAKIRGLWFADAVLCVITFGWGHCSTVLADGAGADPGAAGSQFAQDEVVNNALKRPSGSGVAAVLSNGMRRDYRRLGEIAKPDAVCEIQISAGDFSDADAAALEPFTQIESLILPGSFRLLANPRVAPLSGITDKGLRAISKHRTLVTLTIGSHRITDAGVASLGELAKLRVLELRASHVTDVGVASLAGIHSLETAFLELPLMSDAGLAALAPLPALSNLNLACVTSVTGTGLESFPQDCALREIAANFTDDGLVALRRLRVPLRSVDIVGTRASTAAILSIDDLPHLSRVGLFKTSLTAYDVETWRRKVGRRNKARRIRIVYGGDDALKELAELCDRVQQLGSGATHKAKAIETGIVPCWAGP